MSDMPERLNIYRRIASKDLHIGEHGETMSHANADGATYIRADIAKADLDAAVRAERETCEKVADMLHQYWAHAKGRNPDDYTSAYSRLRDAIRERGK